MIRLIVLLILLAQGSVQAELFVGPTTPAHRFVLAAGQVAMISGIHPKFLYNSEGGKLGPEAPELGASIVTSTETNVVYFGECNQGTTALAGPLELVVSNTVAISYRVITNTSIQTPVIKSGTTHRIEIPAGKTLRFLAFGIDGYRLLLPNSEITQGANHFTGYDIYGGAEFDGPLTLSFTYPSFEGAKGFSLPYYISDQATVLPDQAALQAPTGNFELQVQKSSDLVHWSPSVVLPRSSDTKSFYRIRIDK